MPWNCFKYLLDYWTIYSKFRRKKITREKIKNPVLSMLIYRSKKFDFDKSFIHAGKTVPRHSLKFFWDPEDIDAVGNCFDSKQKSLNISCIWTIKKNTKSRQMSRNSWSLYTRILIVSAGFKSCKCYTSN